MARFASFFFSYIPCRHSAISEGMTQLYPNIFMSFIAEVDLTLQNSIHCLTEMSFTWLHLSCGSMHLAVQVEDRACADSPHNRRLAFQWAYTRCGWVWAHRWTWSQTCSSLLCWQRQCRLHWPPAWASWLHTAIHSRMTHAYPWLIAILRCFKILRLDSFEIENSLVEDYNTKADKAGLESSTA